MRPNKRTLQGASEQSNYVGTAKTDKIDLPRDFVVQRILLDTRGTVDVTTTGTLKEDAGARLLSLIHLELTGGKNGSKTVVDLTGVDLYIKNFYDYKRAPERVIPNATQATGQAVSFPLVIDFRLAHNNPDDFSVAIPFYALSSATLSLTWDTVANGYGSGTYANFNITTSITLFEGIPESDAEKQNQLKAPLITMLSRQFTYSSAASGDEPRDTDIVVGNLIRRIIWIDRNSSSARSDADIASFTLGTADTNFINKINWKSSQLEDLMDYTMPLLDGAIVMTGVTILDFARAPVDEAGNVIGLNTIGMKSGDLKLTVSKGAASPIIRYVQEQVES